jgi:long-chain acyl-CoA synthetase
VLETDHARTPAHATLVCDAARAAARLAKALEGALVDAELTLAQYRALAHLSRGDSAPSSMAGGLAVSRPTVTALLDGLRARGLAERRPDPIDGRRATHHLTAAGREALSAADAATTARLEALAEHLVDVDGPGTLAALAAWGPAIDSALEERSRRPGTGGSGTP